jgi:hypothetical protein
MLTIASAGYVSTQFGYGADFKTRKLTYADVC